MSDTPSGLFNPGLRCWFNAAFQAWNTAGRALARSEATIPEGSTPYMVKLRSALYESSPNRADAFFEEFARKFFTDSRESATGQHDPVAAFCAIAAHSEIPELRVQFLGLAVRTVSCEICHVSATTRYPEPVYSCRDLSVLATPDNLARHVLGSVQAITGVKIPGCSCPEGAPQILRETHKLPRIMVLAINKWEPDPAKANIPRVFRTPTHIHVLLAAICKSGPPSGGHCWAYARADMDNFRELGVSAAVSSAPTWLQLNDYSVTPSESLDSNVIAGIYWRLAPPAEK